MAAASAVVDRLLRRLASNGPEVELPSAVKEDMVHVKKALSRWHAVLENTERQLFEGGSGEYLVRSKVLMSKENKMMEIKQIAYDIEDILDEFEDYGRRSGGGSERTEEVFCCPLGPFLSTTTASRMKMARKKLDHESEKSIIFSLLRHSKPDLETIDEQGSFDIDSIIGRDEDKENIKKIINDSGPFSIIPIVGLCGIGKTSLARLIFNDRGEDCKFDHHIWISLNMSFDLSNIVNGIISQAGNKEEGTSQKNQGTLKNLVRQALTDKRSLVVLDNLWSMDKIQLDELKEILSTVICSVIVTTSSEEVAKLFNTVLPYKLGLLSDSNCWTIFSGVASKDQETRDNVVKLCQGMPVVARSLTSVVQAKGKNVWKDAKNKELWYLEKLLVPKIKMFRSLKQIYYRMPSGLKSCLGYLSIFPKGFHIDAEKLIWQWSALDMLGSNHGILPPYVQGKNYIQTLLSIFYLQAPEQCSANGMVLINGKNVLEMHSLVHSFARYVSSDELIIFEDRVAPINSKKGATFRYALLLECNEASTIPKGFLTKARAVSFKGCKARKLPEEALSALCHLNVLDLSGCSFLELPSSVGLLKHLRYLDVSHSGLQSLPSELRSLRNLVALDLSRNTINNVPLDLIGPFEKLKYLNLQECPNLRDLLRTFGDLKALEHLNMSGCSEVSELPEILCSFSALQLLDLSSCAELKKLPRSLGSLKNLGDLNLSGCSRLEQLPETFHELYSLKFLNLENCSMLQQLPHLFGNLKTLEILNLSGCTSLQKLPKSFGGLYFLRVLRLDGCFGLQESPKVLGNLLNLENLNLAHISLELPEALINLRRLNTLDLTGCGFKKSFADIVNKMTNLKFVLTDDSRLALSVSRHILVSTENNKQSCVDIHVIQSRDLEQAGIVGEIDADEIVETLETGKGTTDMASPQQETRSSFELIVVEDKDSSASSKNVEFSAGTQDHTPMRMRRRPRLRRGSSALLYAMGNCFGSPDAAAKPPGHPTKGPPTTRPKASDSGGSGTQEKADGPGLGGWVLEASRLREFTLAELIVATRGFKPDMVFGEGGFGRVYKGWVDERTLNPARSNDSDAVAVAVKKLNPESFQGVQEWQSEIKILGRLSHPNLVRLLGYCGEDRELLLVYEFMSRGSLDNHLFKRGGNLEALSWSRRIKIATGAARGLAFLHSLEEQVIYRGFKTSSILLDSDFTAKLSDFGLAINGPPAGESHLEIQVMGTYGYAAPEYVATVRHLYVKSDVYGFGVVLLEMLTGLRALDRGRPAQQHNLVEWAKPYLTDRRKLARLVDPRLEGQYPPKAALQAAQLTLNCLEGDPRSRPSMAEVVLALEDIEQLQTAQESAASRTLTTCKAPVREERRLRLRERARREPAEPPAQPGGVGAALPLRRRQAQELHGPAD